MKQLLLLFVLFSLSHLCTAQEYKPLDSALAVFLHSNSSTRSGMSIRYLKKIENAGRIKLSFNSNFKDLYRWKAGYEIMWLEISRVEVGSGIDAKFTYINFDSSVDNPYKELAFELPLESRTTLSNNWRILVGISWIKRIWTNEVNINQNFNIELRAGLEYKF
ncbi:MAG: hypothetical protein P1U56_24140 [Saprospiraceae bacterium]|nr:hypothetical protein [Saprospiraceae bacterium]